MWHRRTCFSAAVTRETTVLVSHHTRFLNVFIKSITNALIQLCLFISLEGFNRWKLGSSVSNKLDKQTKNHCVEPHSKMLFIHFEQEISEINLYFYMYESALSNCCIFFIVNRRLKTTRTCQCRFAFQPVDISFWNRTQSFHFQERYSSQIRSLFKMTSTLLSTSTLLQVYIISNVWGYILEIAAVVCSLNSVDLLVCAEKLVYLFSFFLYLIHHNLRWMM